MQCYKHCIRVSALEANALGTEIPLPRHTIVIGFVGCSINIPAGAGLNTPEEATRIVHKNVWVAPVEIRFSVSDRDTLEESLTISIIDYIREWKMFPSVRGLPGKPRAEDYVLRFTLNRYDEHRRLLPYALPFSFVTLTFYMFFGGPLMEDSVDLAGHLVVEDSEGNLITQSNAEFADAKKRSMWAPEYILPGDTEARTRFIRTLLDRATTNLR